jgi:hypothetical protein
MVDRYVLHQRGAIDFVRKNLHVENLENLPYDNLLVPLAVYFAGDPNVQKKISNGHRQEIVKWFWRTCLGRRYNSQPVKSLREDVVEFNRLKNGTTKTLSNPAIVIFLTVFFELTQWFLVPTSSC